MTVAQVAPADSARSVRSARSTRGALAALALAVLLPSLGTSIANVSLPTLTRVFDASFQQVQWVVIAYLLATTTVMVIVGHLGDRAGPQRLMLAGIALFTLASGLGGFAPSLGWLIGARALQGLGAATMTVLGLALVGDAVPEGETGRAMGMLGTMSAVGTALGPTIGGLLIAAFDWRAIFFVVVPLGIVAFVLAQRCLAADRPATGVNATTARPLRPDQPGARALALSLVRNPSLRAGFAMSALVTTVVMTALVVGPFYLTGAFGLDPARVGLAMSAGPIVSALTGMPAGRLVDRFGAQRLTVAGLAAMVVGCSVLPLVPMDVGLLGYIAPLVVVTSGYALFQAANNTAVMSATDRATRGVTSGMLQLSRNLGLIAGASVMGQVFAFGSNASGAPLGADSVAAGFKLTYGVAAALIGVALGFASIRHSPVPHPVIPPSKR